MFKCGIGSEFVVFRGRTGSLGFGYGGDEGHEAGAAEELGYEDGGVALCFGGFDPLQTRTQDAGLAAAFAENSAAVAAHDDDQV